MGVREKLGSLATSSETATKKAITDVEYCCELKIIVFETNY